MALYISDQKDYRALSAATLTMWADPPTTNHPSVLRISSGA